MLSNGYLDNTNQIIKEGYDESTIKPILEDAVKNLKQYADPKNNRIALTKKMNRKLCTAAGVSYTGSIGDNSRRQCSEEIDNKYEVYINTDQAKNTANFNKSGVSGFRGQYTTKTISECFDKIKNHADGSGIVYDTKDKQCYVINRRVPEGTSYFSGYDSYENPGAILVIDKKMSYLKSR